MIESTTQDIARFSMSEIFYQLAESSGVFTLPTGSVYNFKLDWDGGQETRLDQSQAFESNDSANNDKPLVSLEGKEETQNVDKQGRPVDSSIAAPFKPKEDMSVGNHNHCDIAILPFSLLDSSIGKEEIVAHAAQTCHIAVSQIADIMPCTPLQEGLIALTTRRPGDYLARYVYEIGEDVDTKLLHEAWDRVAAMNPILRTRIVSLPGVHGLLQVVIDEGLPWSSKYDQGSCQDGTGNEQAMGLGTPLTRLSIAESEIGSPRRLVWEIHHALYDGWSLPLILKEVELAYFRQPSLGLLPITPFIKYLRDRDGVAEMDFWKKHFDKIQGVHFPSAKPDHHAQPDSQIELDISGLDWSHSDFTPANILMAAWSVAVAIESGSDEALFGLTVTGRNAPLQGIEFIAGPTIATVPWRVSLDWDASIFQLLDTMQRQAADMIPFEQTGLQRIAQISDEAALGCKFQSLLVVQPVDLKESDPGKPFLSEVVDGESGSKSDTYPLVVECRLGSDEVMLRIAFDSSIIGQNRVEFVAQNFEFAFRQLSESNPGKRGLREIQGEPWDLHQIWTWNEAVPEPTQDCIHSIIDRRVFQNPSSPAVDAWDGKFTYRNMGDLSTSLALHLCDWRVKGKIVPLLIEKSKWMPIAAIAVMKGGGGCLALDSTQPIKRLRSIVSEVDAPLLLSSSRNEAFARKLTSKSIVVVGPEQKWAASTLNLPLVSPSNVLYVNFTSGSTGVPKGAIVTHGNFCSAVTYQLKALGFSDASRVFDFSSYTFDAAWANCIFSFASGGCLCIPAQDERDNNLAGCLEKYNVNTVDFTPSVARIVGREALSRLSTLMLGGEAVRSDDAYLAGGQTKILNIYGPAECTPIATFAELTSDNIVIGCGAGTCTWVIDLGLQRPSRVGEVGELWLEGPLVGQGYLNDQAKTEQVFIENPAWLARGVPGQFGRTAKPGRQGRLYRTGDLVRYREDGSLIFLGRKDTQVKIRGQRVELGEVEQHVLHALPLYLSARVTAEIVQPEGSKGVMLVAFITLQNVGESNMTEKEHNSTVKQAMEGLTTRLAESIPRHMVPTAFIPMFRLPMMTSGKTDRKMLHDIGESEYLQNRSCGSQEQPEMLLNDIETILQQIWMSVLNLSVQEASVNKAFVRLGGDSITAMQIVAQCKLHNIILTVSDILEASNITKLANRCHIVSRYMPDTGGEHALEDEDAARLFNLSPIQQMFFNANPEGFSHWNQSFLLELSKSVSSNLMRDAMNALVRRHAMLRCRFQKDLATGLWMQRVIDESDVQSFMFAEHYEGRRGNAVEIGRIRQKSLDLQQGPVFACDLVQISDGSQLLVLSAHHAVVDLVSWRIIWADVEDFIFHGKLLSHPTISFRQWCQRQARVGMSLSPLSVLPFTVPEQQLEFWDLPQSENTFSGCETYSQHFDQIKSAALFGNCNDSLRTEPIDILVAALVHSFLRVFPERDPAVIWIEGHGREESDELPFDVTGTVGWFTTLYPLPLPITTEYSVMDAIRLAKDNRRRIPNKGQPYFSCRYHSESGREAFQGHEIPEMTLNFAGQFQQLESADGLFKRPEGMDEEDSELNEISPLAKRFAMIEINAEIDDSQLVVSFQFHKKMKHRDGLKEWIRLFVETLNAAAEELLLASYSFTLTDLPLLPLSYNGLDTLLKVQLPNAGIKPNEVLDIYPCSPMQDGILLSAQKEAASYATFSIWRCVPAQGSVTVSPSRLHKAWRIVVKRHTILQSVFNVHPEGNGFIQIVLSDPTVCNALLATDDSSPENVLSRLKRPLFAANEPEHAFTICESTSGQVACRLDVSHSLIDASSMSCLVQDIINVYDEDTNTSPAAPFRDVIRYVSGTPKAQRIASWAKLLHGIQPCDFPPSRAQMKESIDESFSAVSIPAAAILGIADFCRKWEITRSVFIQVAWSMVLAHFTGKYDVCFGYLANGRDIPVDGIETMVGPLASLLISRVDLRESRRNVIQITSRNSIQHLSIQHTSLAEIQHHLHLSQRLFNTALSMRSSDKFKSSEKKSLKFEPFNGEDPHEFDLGLSAMLDGDTMEIVMEYRERYISQRDAQEAAKVLTTAIKYLLAADVDDFGIDTDQENLFDGFFEYLVGVEEASARSFWQGQFANIEGSHFPSVKPGYRSRTSHEAHIDLRGLTLAGRSGFEPSTIVRTAWALLASRMTGSNEALFGVTTSGGDTVVPIRVELDWHNSVCNLLRKVQRQGDSITQFERTGLHRIKSLSDEAAFGCDFQTVVQVIDQEARQTQRHTDYAMVIECVMGTNDARIRLGFDIGVLGRQQAIRVGHQLEHILRQLLDDSLSECTLDHMRLASPKDIEDIWIWNADVPAAVDSCAHDLIIREARKRPFAQAICAWDGDLTYQEFDELSTNLAIKLIDRGIKPGNPVVLFFEKSMWMPVAVFAVMKAGGVAVATDTATQPETRLRIIVQQFQNKLSLCSVANENLASRISAEVLVVGPEQVRDPIADQSLPTVSPSNLVYIMFTSGSTGAPKGVMVSHRNICSALAYQTEALGYHEHSRVFDFSSYAFDVFWSNLLNTLTAGKFSITSQQRNGTRLTW